MCLLKATTWDRLCFGARRWNNGLEQKGNRGNRSECLAQHFSPPLCIKKRYSIGSIRTSDRTMSHDCPPQASRKAPIKTTPYNLDVITKMSSRFCERGARRKPLQSGRHGTAAPAQPVGPSKRRHSEDICRVAWIWTYSSPLRLNERLAPDTSLSRGRPGEVFAPPFMHTVELAKEADRDLLAAAAAFRSYHQGDGCPLGA